MKIVWKQSKRALSTKAPQLRCAILFILIIWKEPEQAFAYHVELNICFLKSDTEGDSIYREHFVYSRRCGTTSFDCDIKNECRTCPRNGYTTELLGSWPKSQNFRSLQGSVVSNLKFWGFFVQSSYRKNNPESLKTKPLKPPNDLLFERFFNYFAQFCSGVN